MYTHTHKQRLANKHSIRREKEDKQKTKEETLICDISNKTADTAKYYYFFLFFGENKMQNT